MEKIDKWNGKMINGDLQKWWNRNCIGSWWCEMNPITEIGKNKNTNKIAKIGKKCQSMLNITVGVKNSSLTTYNGIVIIQSGFRRKQWYQN